MSETLRAIDTHKMRIDEDGEPYCKHCEENEMWCLRNVCPEAEPQSFGYRSMEEMELALNAAAPSQPTGEPSEPSSSHRT